jgi:hypothetical protein
MNTKIYLTETLKNYYNSDLLSLTNDKTLGLYNLDDGLDKVLKSINLNPEIQSIYSKWYRQNPDVWDLNTKSYLILVYTEKIEKLLISVLTSLKDQFSTENSECNYYLSEPGENPNFSPDSKFKIGCLINPDYFRINHVKIEIDSGEDSLHDIFWESLGNKLSNLK